MSVEAEKLERLTKISTDIRDLYWVSTYSQRKSEFPTILERVIIVFRDESNYVSYGTVSQEA